jgi:hypothetical protein
MLEWVFVTNRVRYDRLFGLATANEDHSDHTLCALSDHLHATVLAGNAVLKVEGAPDVDRRRLQKEGLYYLVIHELGHTLGLNHNMKSSQLHSARSVHDTAVTEQVGLTGSVMDYPAINLAPTGQKQGQFYTTSPGPYDNWAIEFGYSSKVDDLVYRRELLARSIEPALRFGNDADDMRTPGKGIDPRVMIGDMSSDAVTYAVERVDRIREVMGNALGKYTGEDGSYHELRDAFMVLTSEQAVAARVISRYVGGVLVERAAPGQAGAPQPLSPVPVETQRRALRALRDKIFAPEAMTAPEKLLAHARLMRRGFSFGEKNEDLPLHQHLLRIQAGALDHLLHPRTLARLSDSSLYGQAYPLTEMFDGLTAAIFEEDRAATVNSVRRGLQVEYVKRLIDLVEAANDPAKSDHLSVSAAWGQLQAIKANPGSTSSRLDAATLTHRRYLSWRIERALEGKGK